MENILKYVELLCSRQSQEVAMDHCHYLQIIGSLVAKKPDRVLEVGIGTAGLTAGLVMALRFNRKGHLTCIDNWCDWQGSEPPGIDALRDAGVSVIAPIDEEEFVTSSETDTYDFVISDGDHARSSAWFEHYLRITKPEGFLYFHDSNNTGLFPSLSSILRRVEELGIPHYHFTNNSRDDERCDRGLLFIINR